MTDLHVDYRVLATLRDVMEGDYLNLLDVFLDDSAQRVLALQQMQQALAQALDREAELQELGMMAHSFKGSSSNLGAVQLAELCHQLEVQARSNLHVSPDVIQQLIAEIGCEYLLVREAFDIERQAHVVHP